MSDYMVNVFDEDGKIIGQVAYNSCLDYWDGQNWTNGGTGRHSGLTQLEDGRFVLIHGTQWQGEKDSARIITPERALQEVLRAGIDVSQWPELEELRNKNIIKEKTRDNIRA